MFMIGLFHVFLPNAGGAKMAKRRNTKNKIIIDIPERKGFKDFIRSNQNVIFLIIITGFLMGICSIFVPILDILQSVIDFFYKFLTGAF